jgi:hypothetical protein
VYVCRSRRWPFPDFGRLSQAGPNFTTTDKPATLPAEGIDLSGRSGGSSGSRAGFRLTVRTHLVLTAVAERAGASNQEIAKAAGIRDQGQISRLLARLESHGLLANTMSETQGSPNAPGSSHTAVKSSCTRAALLGREPGEARQLDPNQLQPTRRGVGEHPAPSFHKQAGRDTAAGRKR